MCYYLYRIEYLHTVLDTFKWVMNMKKKHKITLLVIGILLALSLMLSSSYALWVFNASQESTNAVQADCFEITFTEGSQAIHLTNSFPMKDGDGVYTTPYEFTLTNICGQAADISINLETLNDSQIVGENLRVDVNGHVHTYGDNNYVEPTLENASSSASFYNDTIAAGDSKSYNLRLWLKEDANNVDVINRSYSSKIIISSTLRKNYSEAALINGKDFNVALKKLADGGNPKYTSNNDSITSIQMSDSVPDENNTTINIAAEESDYPIYAWFDNGTIYINSEADKIYMNPDSSYMFYIFRSATNLDLSRFDTSKVTNMFRMFSNMVNITSLDMSNFDTSKVTDMSYMFSLLDISVGLDVSNFDTSKVTDMSYMFFGMSNLVDLDVSHFNTSKVTNMSWMFYGMENLTSLDVSNFDTSNTTDLSRMFAHLKNVLKLDVSSFNTSNAINIRDMFSEMSGLTNLDVSHFDTSNVTDMQGMFRGLENLTSLDVSNFNTSKVTSMAAMFRGVSSIKSLDVSNFDTSNVTGMTEMFSKMESLEYLDISGFNTPKLIYIFGMFEYDYNLVEINFGEFDVSNVKDMHNLFYLNYKLQKIYVSRDWDTSSATSVYSIFSGCDNLVGGAGTKYNSSNDKRTYARIDDPDNGRPGYFTLKTN